jgi:hypothetical protein
VDEDVIFIIKKRCEEAAREGKFYIYIDLKLSKATKEALEKREGLKLTISLSSYFTYQISW